MDKRTKEIRTILTGFITLDEESGQIVAAQRLRDMRSLDLFSGADAARFLGVHVTKRQFFAQGKAQDAWQQCIGLFATGLPLRLTTAPDVLATLYRPLWGKPSVITMEMKNQQFLLCLYTARTLFARLRAKRLMKKIIPMLPESLQETTVSMTEQGAEKKTSAAKKSTEQSTEKSTEESGKKEKRRFPSLRKKQGE